MVGQYQTKEADNKQDQRKQLIRSIFKKEEGVNTEGKEITKYSFTKDKGFGIGWLPSFKIYQQYIT